MTRPHLRLCAASTAIGIACVSVALGLLYRDASMLELQLAQLAAEQHTSPDAVDTDALGMMADPAYWLGALASGTLGVALLAIGTTVFLYDLPGLIRAARQSHPPTYDRP